MDNVNWIVTLIIGALLSIPVGIFVNIVTPNARDWMSKYSLKIRESNVLRLNQELSYLEYYKLNRNLIYIPVILEILQASFGIFVGLILAIIGITVIVFPDPFISADIKLLTVKYIGVAFEVIGIVFIMLSGIILSVTLVNDIVNKYVNIEIYINSLRAKIDEIRNQTK